MRFGREPHTGDNYTSYRRFDDFWDKALRDGD